MREGGVARRLRRPVPVPVAARQLPVPTLLQRVFDVATPAHEGPRPSGRPSAGRGRSIRYFPF